MNYRPAIPACLLLGSGTAYGIFLFELPAWSLFVLLLPALLLLQFDRVLWTLLASIITLGTLLATINDQYQPVPGANPIVIEGRVSGLAEVHQNYTRFRFRPAARPGQESPEQLPDQVLMYWYRDAPEIRAGQSWRLEVQLKPPRGLINFQGTDRERWLFAEKIGGVATVRQGELLKQGSGHMLQPGWLDRVRQHISGQLASSPDPWNSNGVVSALAVADRSGLDPDQRQTLALTGTSHLLAISGLHIGLSFMLAYWLCRLLLFLPGKFIPHAHLCSLLLGWLAALGYAGLAGYSNSTIRALVMLSVAVTIIIVRRNTHSAHGWTLALALVLLVDPMAPLKAGTWLSFVAVAALMLWFVPRKGIVSGPVSKLLQAQFAVMLFTLPFSAWWFQQASPSGFITNLVAIPWVSLVVVPLILFALLVWPLGPISEWLLQIAAAASAALLAILEPAARWSEGFAQLSQPGWLSLLAAVLGSALLLLPGGLRLKPAGVLLLLPLVLPVKHLAAGIQQLEVLDVGQGTAVLLSSQSELLLYDSGPGDGRGNDLFDSVIHPAVLATGQRKPSRIVISHADLDHAGGMGSIQQRYRGVPIFASLPQSIDGIEPCNDQLRWSWLSREIRVLHPSKHLPYLGNDSSCVLDVDAGRFKLLLSGDISARVERRLVDRQLDVFRILLVPHHGSLSSSTPGLLHATIPELAIATAGADNRFGFPRPEVRQRYENAGVKLISTDQCGAIRLQFDQDGQLLAQSARRQRAAPWRWPAGAGCP